MEKTAVFCLIFFSSLVCLARTAPSAEFDVAETNFDGLSGQGVDYNSVMANFKDFFMYLPVMFSTLRDTISGFPKLAESIRILASPYEKPYSDDDDDCKCKSALRKNINEIDKSSNR